jgi:hypothetical protein
MKRFWYLFLLIGLLVGTSSLQSCSRKSGCPAIENPKSKRNGKLSKRKGSSQLFPKKMRKKGR